MNRLPFWAQERVQAIALIRDRLPGVALFLAISVLEGMSRTRYPRDVESNPSEAFRKYVEEQWDRYWINENGPGSYPMPGVPYYGNDKRLIDNAVEHVVPKPGESGYPGACGPPFYMVSFGRVLYSIFRKPMVHEGGASALRVLGSGEECQYDGVMLGPARFCNTPDGELWLFDASLADFLLQLPLQ